MFPGQISICVENKSCYKYNNVENSFKIFLFYLSWFDKKKGFLRIKKNLFDKMTIQCIIRKNMLAFRVSTKNSF